MTNQDLARLQSRFLLFGGILLACNVFITLISASRRAQINRKLDVDKNDFYSAVSVGTSNFLANVYPLTNFVQRSYSEDTIDVQYVDVCTWETFRGVSCCRIDGVDYYVGDYCQHGQIFAISSGRVYVRRGSQITILRRRASDADAPLERGVDAPGEVRSMRYPRIAHKKIA